jgi:hypothetical protein
VEIKERCSQIYNSTAITTSNIGRKTTNSTKLLIQRVSPLIPVIHIKNGILGSRGHVVSFFQDITDICSELPRLPSDVTMIKVVRTGTTVDGENLQNIFNVNRYRISNALLWLKEHNSLWPVRVSI